MKLGVFSYNTEYGIRPDDLARALEERGFESIWVGEHTHIPVTSDPANFPGAGDTIPRTYPRLLDPEVHQVVAAALIWSGEGERPDTILGTLRLEEVNDIVVRKGQLRAAARLPRLVRAVLEVVVDDLLIGHRRRRRDEGRCYHRGGEQSCAESFGSFRPSHLRSFATVWLQPSCR